MIDAAARQFALERVLKRSQRGTVELLRHLATGKRYVFRRYIGSADVYRKLLDITCPHLPRIEEVAEKDGAAFCPYCTATQVERKVISAPRTHRRGKRIALAGIALAAVIALCTAALYTPTGETGEQEDAGVEVLPALPENTAVTEPTDDGHMAEGATCPYYLTYTAEDGETYQLFTGYTPETENTLQPVGTWERWLRDGGMDSSPICLYAVNYQGQTCPEKFDKLVEDYDVTVSYQDNGEWTEVASTNASELEEVAQPAGVLYYRRVNMNVSQGITVFRWTLHMKNGDTVILEQTFNIHIKKEVHYDGSSTPLDTAQQLQTLLDSLPRLGEPAEYCVLIELPAATYDAPIDSSAPLPAGIWAPNPATADGYSYRTAVFWITARPCGTIPCTAPSTAACASGAPS